MKRHALLLLSLLAVAIISFAGIITTTKDEPKSPSWRVLYGHQSKLAKAYVDDNSMVRKQEDGKDMAIGAILMSAKESYLTEIEKGNIIHYQSIVRHLVVDCKNMILAPIADFYFNTAFPAKGDVPVYTFKYTLEAAASKLQSDSFIYTAFCPVYI